MDFFDHTLQPSQVESLIGMANAEIRDLRRRGLVKSAGHQDSSGRWWYSLRDALHLWIFRFLVNQGAPRDVADVAGVVISAQLGFFLDWEDGGPWEKDASCWKEGRYYHATVGEKPGWDIVRSLSGVCKDGAAFGYIFDMKAIACQVPSKLVESFRGLSNQMQDHAESTRQMLHVPSCGAVETEAKSTP